MNNTQGVQDVSLPESIKNALELAQNRISLLNGDEDRLRKLKVSLEVEVSALDELKKIKDAENKTLDNDKIDKSNQIGVLEGRIFKLKEEQGKLVAENNSLKLEKQSLIDEKAREQKDLDSIKEDIKNKQTTSSELDLEVAKKTAKIKTFVNSINNLI